jgi:hypothetical protein
MKYIILSMLLALTMCQDTFLYDNTVSNGNPFDEATHEYYVNPWFSQEV